MQRIAYSAVLALSVLALHAQAQTMKPGLWEMTNKMQGGPGETEKAMAEAQKQMAAMPPEQRKMMQDMMAKQGVSIGTGGSGAMSVNICITREMIDNNELSAPAGDCKTTNSPRVGNAMKVSYVCTKPPSSGEGQITFAGPEAFSSKMTVNSASGGKSEKMTMEGQGKWLSAECGAIKPVARPTK
jgi:hypothetical protein